MGTGGTIASVGQASAGNLIARAKGEELLGQLSSIDELGIDISIVNYSVVNSTALTPTEMIQMAQQINGLLAQDDVVGVVITHGTALMEETAFVLDMLITDSTKPVVITGAQRNINYPWPDGLSNLNDALHVAASPEARNMGVMGVFCGRIFEGFRMIKVHSTALDPFSAGEHGQLGSIAFNKVTFYRDRTNKKLPFADFCERSVAITPFYSGADGRYIRAAMESGEDGIVVEGVGIGNVNTHFYDAIAEARDSGIPIVLTSRCCYGELLPIYAYKGGGASLKELGVMLSNLPSSKARLLLILILGGGCQAQDIEKFIF